MKGLRFGLLFATLVGALLVLGSTAAMAQTSKGAVTGTVTDPSGAVIPDASVVLKNKETVATRDTKTNAVGIYRFDAVDLGLYSITVKVPGFKQAVLENIEIQANRTASFDFQVELGLGALVVQVEATTTDLLQTSEPLRGGNFEPRSIVNLPIQFADSLNLIL